MLTHDEYGIDDAEYKNWKVPEERLPVGTWLLGTDMHHGAHGHSFSDALTAWKAITCEQVKKPTQECEFKWPLKCLCGVIERRTECKGNKPVDELRGETITD